MDKKKEKLVLDNMNLAYSIAIKYAGRLKNVFELDDIKQMCLEALIQAALYYDNDKGVAFSTYAYTSIYNNLMGLVNIEIRKKGGAIVLSLDAALTENDEDFSLLSVLSDQKDLTEPLILDDEIATLYSYINELDEPYKTIMLLKCEGKSLRAIADILKRTDRTINTHYKNGLNMLRTKYNRDRSKYGD